MEICNKYQPRKCWANGAIENAVTCGGDCSKCTLNCEKKNIPTFQELADEYPKYANSTGGLIRPVTVKHRLHSLNVLYRHCRIEPTDRVTALTEDMWEEFLLSARQRLSPNSIKSCGSNIHALLTKKSIKYFSAKRGWDCDRFPDLSIDAKSPVWNSLSSDQRRKIRDYQFGLFQLADPRKYLCVTAAWERGQRKCDVLRNHWSQFCEHDGAVWWPYTSVKNGKASNWPVDPDTWRMLKVAKERLGKLRVNGLGSHPDSYLRVREYRRDELATYAIWNECGEDLRAIMGWNGSKSMHNLRKDSTDTVFQKLGIDEAEEFSTDCAKTLRKHYIARKHIMPNIPSIAKMQKRHHRLSRMCGFRRADTRAV